MKGTIKRVGKIYRDGHGALQMEGWDIAPGGIFSLQDLITIALVYPFGKGPYVFGMPDTPNPPPKPTKVENKPQFRKRKKGHRR